MQGYLLLLLGALLVGLVFGEESNLKGVALRGVAEDRELLTTHAVFSFPVSTATYVVPSGALAGEKVEYATAGNLATATKVILSIHGAPGTWDAGILAAQTWYLADPTNRAIIAPSRPGYGATPLTAKVTTFAQQAELTLELVKGLIGTRAVIVMGYSNGGPIAVEYTKLTGANVAGLIQICTVATKYWDGQPAGASDPGSAQASLNNDSVWEAMKGDTPLIATLVGLVYNHITNVVPDSALAYMIIDDLQIGWGPFRKTAEALILSASTSLMTFADNYVITSFGDAGQKLVGYQNDVVQNYNLAGSVTVPDVPMLVIHADSDRFITLAQSQAMFNGHTGSSYKSLKRLSYSHHAPFFSRDSNKLKTEVENFIVTKC